VIAIAVVRVAIGVPVLIPWVGQRVYLTLVEGAITRENVDELVSGYQVARSDLGFLRPHAGE
jgi:hypothetical protein